MGLSPPLGFDSRKPKHVASIISQLKILRFSLKEKRMIVSGKVREK